MHTYKVERKQGDGLQDEYSQLAGLYCPPDEDQTRQEFKDEADINVLLKRFGVAAPQQQLRFGAADYDLDLQQAMTAVAEVKEMYAKLPANLREKYPSWTELLNAIDRGDLAIINEEPVLSESPKVDTPSNGGVT